MLKSFFVFIRFYLFWILFFALERLVFLVYFSEKLSQRSFGEKASTFWYALRLDSSMIAYISVVPLLIYLFFLFLRRSFVPRSVPRTFVIILISLFSIITAFNFNLYREWGSKINYRAVEMAFSSTKEAIASGSSSPVLLSAFILLGLIAFGIFLSDKIIDYRIYDSGQSLVKKISGSFIALAVCVLMIRGGWQLSPINQSMAYFSAETVLNHAAVNTEWNLLHDVLNNKYGRGNPYKYYERKEAESIVSKLFEKPAEQTNLVLRLERPNVVLILVESFTAELIESLGGEKGVAPNMTQLSREGLLFTDIYAAAGRTDKGMIASLSAFPGQAIRSIMKNNDKQEKLPGVARELKSKGYSTSFYYGGESEFFNMKSYILSHGYDKLIDQHSFEKKDMNSKWGTYDHLVFQKNLSDLSKEKQPFFSTILTLTNHEPFELPGKLRYGSDNVENKFRSTFFYTDSCLGSFIKDARKTDWYKNTLFIIVADHSHRLPGNVAEYDPKRYRIPLLFYGDVLKPEFRGKTVDKTGNQTDLAATLLTQLNIDPSRFKWSKDLLNPGTPGFAFFNWDNGFAFGTKEQIVSFDNVGQNILLRKNPANTQHDEKLTYYGKAYMQTVFQEYLDY
jgi:phosphoglycerol transferase MdoB-like AlkP superfamily enzyme